MSFAVNKKMTIGDWINYIVIVVISLACLVPFFYVIVISLTDPEVYVPFQFKLWPEKWSLASYSYTVVNEQLYQFAQKHVVYYGSRHDLKRCGHVQHGLRLDEKDDAGPQPDLDARRLYFRF